MIRFRMVLCLIFVALGCNSQTDQTDLNLGAVNIELGREATSKAFSAQERMDYPMFLEWMKRANAFRPGHPTLVYHLGRAYMLNDSTQAALEVFYGLAAMGVSVGFDDAALLPLRLLDGGPELESKLLENETPIVRSKQVYQGQDSDYQAEGLARYKGEWILASVHKTKIGWGNGRPLLNISPHSAMGMKRNGSDLWVAATKTMEGGNPQDEIGHAKLLQIDLNTATLKAEYSVEDSLDHWFGDVEVLPDGTVFISDSNAPGVYTLEGEHLVPVVVGQPLSSPQGLAYVNGSLYLADYAGGLFEWDTKRKTATLLEAAPNVTLLGIDGLIAYQSGVLGIQNGMTPPRVVFVDLTNRKDPLRIRTLENNHPDYHDPTLGLVDSDTLFYMANSQWPLFGAGADSTQRVPPIILGLPLHDAGQ